MHGSKEHRDNPNANERERRLFEALRRPDEDGVAIDFLVERLEKTGLRLSDPLLSQNKSILRKLSTTTEGRRRLLTFPEFLGAVQPSLDLIDRALEGRLIIPDFITFGQEITRICERAALDTGGKVADYIPQLSRVDPNQFGVAFTSIDGQRFDWGDAKTTFCAQSCCKPLLYGLAIEERGEEIVHSRIGCEPSGAGFNELTLDATRRPHNPLINAGAIVSSSLIAPELPLADRFELVMAVWKDLCGGRRPGFSNATYQSERKTADRNFALGYFMREHNVFEEGSDLLETLEFYFQCCSIETTCADMSVLAATLANGGVCPLTGERVFQPSTVQKCLSLMDSCGMYNFSGEWSFRIGLPAKSGVAGATVCVVPNVGGFCTWSPRLDSNGNSVRSIAFFRELIAEYNFHAYDNLVGPLSGKKDPRVSRTELAIEPNVLLCWAAKMGDRSCIRRLIARGVDCATTDYDNRTPLHIAAAEGHQDIVAYLIDHGAPTTVQDRWGETPLDEALRVGHEGIVQLLQKANGAS